MVTALRVQTVATAGASGLLRMLRSVAAAVRCLGDEWTLTVALGDCGGPEGPDALLGEEVLAGPREILVGADVVFDYVPFMANTGHGAGQNLLAKRPAETLGTEGMQDLIVLLNPDTYLSPVCLGALVRVLGDGHRGHRRSPPDSARAPEGL